MICRVLAILALYGACTAQTTVITGQVTDLSGQGAAAARVFIEPGLGGELVESKVDGEGRFRAEGPFQGGVGVFALAAGLGLSGEHLTLALGENCTPLQLVLGAQVAVSGTVLNEKGEPVPGARITRIALSRPSKVGIPLAKLAAFGVAEPKSDEKGKFRIEGLPEGATVAIKVGHPEYAQEAVDEITAGQDNVKVKMGRGVLIRGEVKSRQNQAPVSGSVVVLRNTQAPHDTSVGKTDGFGSYSLRLKPGVYLCQATAVGQTTAGWQKVTVSGELPEQTISLGLAGVGAIQGSIGDAVSGNPVEGVRIRLESGGNVAAMVRTNAKGEFRMAAAEGENILYFDATPGYLPPDPRAMRVSVQSGGAVELPGMWLVPLPTYKMQVVEEDEATPVPGAVITLLRPRQFGWLSTDENGWGEIRVVNLPQDGRVIGFAEHPTKAAGAVFALDRSATAGAKVKLMPYGSVAGVVVNEKGKPVADAVVGAAFPDSPVDNPLLLWRTVTDGEGRFRWDAVVPGVPQRCAVGGTGAQGESANFNLAPNETKDLGTLTVSGSAKEEGEGGGFKLAHWREEKPDCGAVSKRPGHPSLVVFCDQAAADLVIEGLDQALRAAKRTGWDAAVVVRGGYACKDAPLPVFSGTPPGAATSYLLNAEGAVTLRTFGLPPLRYLVSAP
jgi:hypothetical protein